jgi:hypothetical protein
MGKISTVIKVRRWKWIGHVLRSHPDSHARTTITWTPEGRRKQGRPIKGDMEENCGEREETSRIQVIE